MKGIELSEKFFTEHGLPMIQSQFPDIMHLLAFGLVGSGSECFGFDDDISRDHDFEAGFCIFIPDNDLIDSRTQFRLERAYASLPKEFMGFRRSNILPVGGNRHGVINIGDFFESKIGCRDGKLSLGNWFAIPENSLAEAVNGKIFADNYGALTEIRALVSQMPEDVRLKKIAGKLLMMGQSGQYNYPRCISRGDSAAAQLSVIEFCQNAINVIFLINRTYMPYYKWTFRALKNLPYLSHLADDLEYLMSNANTSAEAEKKVAVIEKICACIADSLRLQSLTEYGGNEAEGHAYSVNNKIKDGNIRNLHILYAV